MNFLELFPKYGGFIILYAIVLIFSVFYRKKYGHSLTLKLWVCFLIYSFLTEVIGHFFVNILLKRTHINYNTWFIVNVFFYLLFFLSKIETKLKRKIAKGLIFTYLVFILSDVLFFTNYAEESITNGFIIGSFFVVISIMLFFTELLQKDIVLRLNKTIYFWISIGVLIFHIGLLPVFIIGELIQWQGIFKYLIFVLNVILIFCFIIGFIISKKEYNS